MEVGENANISRMAEILSKEVFAEFLWQQIGPMNKSWQCEQKEAHDTKEHPSDVVFFYDEPYSHSRTYINCDLKSYSKSSITSDAITKAAVSLSKQIACAEQSAEWQSLYVHDDMDYNVIGLLFVYNHDGQYEGDFRKRLDSIDIKDLHHPAGSKIIILGPEDIHWLDNIRYEITYMRGSQNSDRLPDREFYRYFYPQLPGRRNLQLDKAKAATLDILTSQYVILHYKDPRHSDREGVIVFYRRADATAQDFMYLIDYLRLHGLIKENITVKIKTLHSGNLPVEFQKGMQQYIEGLNDGYQDSSPQQTDISPLAELIKEIKLSPFSQVRTTFSDIPIGMDYE